MQAAQLKPVGCFTERRVERGGENAIQLDEVCECPHRASAGPSGQPECAACGIECGEVLDIGLDPILGRVEGDRLTETVNGHNDHPVVVGAERAATALTAGPKRTPRNGSGLAVSLRSTRRWWVATTEHRWVWAVVPSSARVGVAVGTGVSFVRCSSGTRGEGSRPGCEVPFTSLRPCDSPFSLRTSTDWAGGRVRPSQRTVTPPRQSADSCMGRARARPRIASQPRRPCDRTPKDHRHHRLRGGSS